MSRTSTVKYPLMLLVGMLVACPEKPKVTSAPTDSDANVMPMVEFVNPPNKESTRTSVTVRVRASNNATVEYAYAFIPGVGDCNTQQYSTWRDFGERITITPTKIGNPGKKTLCAKGRKKDHTEQSNPSSYEWEHQDADLSPDPIDDGGGADPGGNDGEGEVTAEPEEAPADDDESEGEGEEHSLATDDAEPLTTEKLELSKGVVKFFSARKVMETIEIQNKDNMDSLTYSLTTEHTAGLLEVRVEDNEWKTVKKKGTTSITTENLDGGGKHTLQLRLAHKWKTDYGGDKQIDIKFSDGSDSVTLPVHILAPQLQITAPDGDATSSADKPVEVDLTPSDKMKALTITNKKGDLNVLKWDVYPYQWKPNWFDYSKDKEDKLTVKLSEDCKLYPDADADDELTLIIVSNSDSAGMKPRSFALFHYQQEIQWQEEGKMELQKKETEWRTNDIRYVVVKFKNEEGATCP